MLIKITYARNPRTVFNFFFQKVCSHQQFIVSVTRDVGDDWRGRGGGVGGDHEGVGGGTLALLGEGSKDDAVLGVRT